MLPLIVVELVESQLAVPRQLFAKVSPDVGVTSRGVLRIHVRARLLGGGPSADRAALPKPAPSRCSCDFAWRVWLAKPKNANEIGGSSRGIKALDLC